MAMLVITRGYSKHFWWPRGWFVIGFSSFPHSSIADHRWSLTSSFHEPSAQPKVLSAISWLSENADSQQLLRTAASSCQMFFYFVHSLLVQVRPWPNCRMLDDASHFFSKSSMPQTVRVRFFHMVSGICAEHSYPSQTNKQKRPPWPPFSWIIRHSWGQRCQRATWGASGVGNIGGFRPRNDINITYSNPMD